MKPLNELRAFCEGYHRAMLNTANDMMETALDYVVWGGYDITFSGFEYSGHAMKVGDLHVEAHRAERTDGDEAPVHSFTLYGETA
jgi:hypothetical protein